MFLNVISINFKRCLTHKMAKNPIQCETTFARFYVTVKSLIDLSRHQAKSSNWAEEVAEIEGQRASTGSPRHHKPKDIIATCQSYLRRQSGSVLWQDSALNTQRCPLVVMSQKKIPADAIHFSATKSLIHWNVKWAKFFEERIQILNVTVFIGDPVICVSHLIWVSSE